MPWENYLKRKRFYIYLFIIKMAIYDIPNQAVNNPNRHTEFTCLSTPLPYLFIFKLFHTGWLSLRLVFTFLGVSPVLVEACSVGSECPFPHWAWLCFGSVPGCWARSARIQLRLDTADTSPTNLTGDSPTLMTESTSIDITVHLPH